MGHTGDTFMMKYYLENELLCEIQEEILSGVPKEGGVLDYVDKLVIASNCLCEGQKKRPNFDHSLEQLLFQLSQKILRDYGQNGKPEIFITKKR